MDTLYPFANSDAFLRSMAYQVTCTVLRRLLSLVAQAAAGLNIRIISSLQTPQSPFGTAPYRDAVPTTSGALSVAGQSGQSARGAVRGRAVRQFGGSSGAVRAVREGSSGTEPELGELNGRGPNAGGQPRLALTSASSVVYELPSPPGAVHRNPWSLLISYKWRT